MRISYRRKPMLLLEYHGNKRAVVPGKCYKVKHRSNAAAMKIVKRYGNQKHAYQCPMCGHWHTTTRKKNDTV
jgi:hypothetical protein